MVRRHELSDEEWALLAPLLPPQQTGGRPCHDHRLILNGMLFWLHTGIPWRDLPERYGPWQTVYARFRKWTRDGLWDQLLRRLRRELEAVGAIDWELWCIDGTQIRAHKAAAGARKKKRTSQRPAARTPRRARRSRARSESRRVRDEGASVDRRQRPPAHRGGQSGPGA